MDFGRRMAFERSLVKCMQEQHHPCPNVAFDASSNFIIYASFYGIEIRNLHSNAVCSPQFDLRLELSSAQLHFLFPDSM